MRIAALATHICEGWGLHLQFPGQTETIKLGMDTLVDLTPWIHLLQDCVCWYGDTNWMLGWNFNFT